MKGAVTYRACPTCGSNATRALAAYSPDGQKVATCVSCTLVYLRNPSTLETPQEDDAWEKTYVEKKTRSKGSTPLSPFVRKLRNALGIRRDKTAQWGKWFNHGHVLHAAADKLMRERGNYCGKGAGAEAIRQVNKAQFGGVLMNPYLEHEVGVLKGAQRALKPTGGACVRAPGLAPLNRKIIGPECCGFRCPDHVNYFTLATLTDMAPRAGFTAELVNKVTLHVLDNMSVLLRKAERP